MMLNKNYVLSDAEQAAYEAMPLPVALYQLVDGKIITLAVSDGFCLLHKCSRTVFMHEIPEVIFSHIHPEDVELVTIHTYQLATHGGSFDIRYRARVGDTARYRKIHSFGNLKTMTDGSRVAFITYVDITDIAEAQRDERRRLTAAQKAADMEHQRVEHVMLETIISINNALDARDASTSEHSGRVALYSCELARNLGWSEKRVMNLYAAALLHDIGKIGIPDAVLLKPDVLSFDEREVLKKHVLIGGMILKDFTAIKHVARGALYHHERYDGNGYCKGLRGTAIPIEARIIAVADAVDAMNSVRLYRARLEKKQIIAELEKERGKQFDPDLTDRMLNLIANGLLNRQ